MDSVILFALFRFCVRAPLILLAHFRSGSQLFGPSTSDFWNQVFCLRWAQTEAAWCLLSTASGQIQRGREFVAAWLQTRNFPAKWMLLKGGVFVGRNGNLQFHWQKMLTRLSAITLGKFWISSCFCARDRELRCTFHQTGMDSLKFGSYQAEGKMMLRHF